MAEMIINNWGGGISDDQFLGRTGEFRDLQNIEVRDTARKIKMQPSVEGPTFFSLGTKSGVGTLTQLLETTNGLATIKSNGSNINSIWLDVVNKTSTISGGTTHNVPYERIEFSNNQYFLFTNNAGVNNNIYVLNSNMGAINATKDTIAGGQQNLTTTASCPIYNDKILYAKGNYIYEIDVATWAISGTAKFTIPLKSVVKLLYFNNDSLYVVAVRNNDTYFYIATFNGSSYILRYEKSVIGYECIDAIGNNGMIWWISADGIHQFNGDSQFVKSVTLTTSAKIAYTRSILKIVDGTNFYEYGKLRPGYNNILTRRVNGSTMKVVSKRYVGVEKSSEDRAYLENQSYYDANGTVITLPYMAGEFGELKKGLFIRFGCQFPVWNYSGSTQASIVISVQTDEMERNSAGYATIRTITDHSTRRVQIELTEINTALQTAGYSSDFQYVNIKIQLNAGEEVTISGGDIKYRVTPSIFDLHIKHEEIQND